MKIFFVFIVASFVLFYGCFNKEAVVKEEPIILIRTSVGDIKVKLYKDTPLHRDNFVKLLKAGFYNDLLFHRVISGFMIQAGDPNSKGAEPETVLGNGGPGYTIPAEIVSKYFHKKGALAAARMSDDVNPQKESSGSQFYIVQGKLFTDEGLDMYEQKFNYKFTPEQREAYKSVGGAPHLDGAYTVFGEVIEGFDVIDFIAMQRCDKNDRPEDNIKILEIKILK